MTSGSRRLTTGNTLSVVIVDDHSVVRAGLRFILEAENEVKIVGEAGNADEALEQISRHRPDIVFMDLTLPGVGGIELTRRVRRDYPDTHVIILTLHQEEQYFREALQAGASGYVVKGSRPEDLIAAVKAVRDGGTFLDPKLAAGLVSDYVEQQANDAFEGLSPREREVAELIIDGSSNQEIALHLEISVTTVQTHRSHIMEKLDLRNYGELIRYAIRHGVIDP